MIRRLALLVLVALSAIDMAAAHAQVTPTASVPEHAVTAPDNSRTARRGVAERRLALGLDLMYTKYARLEDIACAPTPGVTMCKVENTSLAARLYAEYSLTRNIGLGLGVSKTDYGVWTFAGQRQFDLYVNAWSFDTFTRWSIGTAGVIEPYAELGGSYIYNDFEYSDPEFLRGPDTQSGMRVNLGAGVQLHVLPQISLQTHYNYVSGGGSDADTQHRVAGGVRYRF